MLKFKKLYKVESGFYNLSEINDLLIVEYYIGNNLWEVIYHTRSISHDSVAI